MSEVRDEVAALEEQNGQLHELTRQQQVVTREVTVEVIPDDYEDLQKSVRELETANRMFSETNQELQRQLEQAGEEASANLLNSAKRELLAFVIKYEQLDELVDVIAVAKTLLGES